MPAAYLLFPSFQLLLPSLRIHEENEEKRLFGSDWTVTEWDLHHLQKWHIFSSSDHFIIRSIRKRDCPHDYCNDSKLNLLLQKYHHFGFIWSMIVIVHLDRNVYLLSHCSVSHVEWFWSDIFLRFLENRFLIEYPSECDERRRCSRKKYFMATTFRAISIHRKYNF